MPSPTTTTAGAVSGASVVSGGDVATAGELVTVTVDTFAVDEATEVDGSAASFEFEPHAERVTTAAPTRAAAQYLVFTIDPPQFDRKR